MGKLIQINLGKKTYKILEIKQNILQKYLGGRGLGAHLYSQNPQPSENKDNSVFLVPGLLTGSMLPSSSRMEIVSSSPLTNYYMASSAGGHFGAYLKHNGIDAIELTGQADEWCYVEIENNEIRIKKAGGLVGKTVSETQEEIKKSFDKKNISVAAIGPAGENLVKFSTVFFDKRAAGRTGTGWHFGYKKIKAIVVVDQKPVITPKEPDQILKMQREALVKKIYKDETTTTYCTPSITEWSNEIQTYPASNYRRNYVSEKEIAGLGLDEYKKNKVGKEACWSCPLACTRIVENMQKNLVRGPEYESIWALGASCDIFDIKTVIESNHLCDEFGMDTLSTGSTLAWYKECIDKKLVDDTWSGKRMLELISEIALNKGVGKKLYGGSLQAAKIFGFGEDFVAHAKGLELPAWDPRVAIGMALSYATSPTGGDHCKGWTVGKDTGNPKTQFSSKGKAMDVVKSQNNMALSDSMGSCMFAEFMFDTNVWAEIVRAMFGWEDTTADKLEKASESIFNLEWEINKKLGHSYEENTMPKRIIGYEVEVSGKIVALTQDIFDEMMQDYKAIRKWS